MLPNEFVRQYHPFAQKVEAETGMPAQFILAQCALETGWARSIAGNNMFGIKDSDGLNGNEQLVLTVEYLTKPNAAFPEVLEITKTADGKKWKYKVRDWFRKYPTPYESFVDHARLLQNAKRYKPAWSFSMTSATPSVEDFARAVIRAGYATAPDYEKVMLAMIRRVRQELDKINGVGNRLESFSLEENEFDLFL